MKSDFYEVYIDNMKIATQMSLMHALILTKALFGEYYNEPTLDIHIKRIDDEVRVEEIDEK